ncbi:protein OSB2, chloroplastic-like isoform X1 [Typha latifolia]|uniref:protein OSB2, chloroplastic-like isoform X1 n=1 Tax=Typha latifolia TaxID=4733 RepID=UPI003C2B3FE5
MNLSRAFAGLLSSSSSSASRSKKWLLVRQIPITALSTDSGAAASPEKRTYKRKPKPAVEDQWSSGWRPPARREESVDLPRPMEIPFQAKVANLVHLVGKIGVPLQLQTLPDGRFAAVSVLVHEKKEEFPQFWYGDLMPLRIPIIFQGNMAQIAACHLKESDLVYITGQLSGDAPPFEMKDSQTNVQVLAHTVSFVQNNYQEKTIHMVDKKGEVNPSSPVYGKKSQNSMEDIWNDLVISPHQWKDNRKDKLNGLVNPKFPDFKHMETKKALWLDSAPHWVLTKLDSLVFDGRYSTRNKEKTTKEFQTEKAGNSRYINNKDRKDASAVPPKTTDDLWKSLVDNPDRWWDNRSNKLNPKSPDFKHKDTGEALWLGSSSTPQWVLSKLPPLITKVNTKKATQAAATLLS